MKNRTISLKKEITKLELTLVYSSEVKTTKNTRNHKPWKKLIATFLGKIVWILVDKLIGKLF
jgi:hypothetical protein